MPKIRLLDDGTINKIAAGEVIERPASVVKELVENSIDAGATKVLIEAIEGGKSLVKVTDDGCGMDSEDLPLAFQKHSTSKISGAQDLANIRTLGFRGEALSSIASVARSIEVYTKPRSAFTGIYMLLEDGEIKGPKEIGCPIGTSIAVKDLFYNVPARRKHLKSTEAELVYMINLVTELAIINYSISFELFTGRRTLFKSNRSNSWDDVLLKIFGLKVLKGLVRFRAESKYCILTGVAGDPLFTRSGPDRIFIYVNGRAVYSKALAGALREAYRSLIPTGRSPIAIVSLEISPSLVDVNVHPTKREIRLLREEEITAMLVQAVAEALKARTEKEIPPVSEPIRAEFPEEKANLKIAGIGEQRSLLLDLAEDEIELPSDLNVHPSLRVLGQVLNLYIVAESEEGLMLIDQHAAAERVRFERLKQAYKTKNVSQELVEPVTVELAPNEQILIEAWKDELEEIGFDIAPFGGNTYNVRAVPAIGKRLESAEAVHDILKDLFALGKIGPDATSKEEILKLLACKSSIKSGMGLALSEMDDLLKNLYACESPLTCPHGRPVAVVFKHDQLDRLFRRR